MKQLSLAIIKPDITRRKLIGDIIKIIQTSDINIIGMKMIWMTQEVAEKFYYIHKGKDFFDPFIKFMTSGPSVVLVLEGIDVIERWRSLMGATNPVDANPGTIRKEYAINGRETSVHGSDSPESAEFEVSFFFKKQELVNLKNS